MSYFDKADKIDPTNLANEYAGVNSRLTRENILLRLQLQQHIDRENKLLAVIKKDLPDFYKTLIDDKSTKTKKS